LEAAPYSGCWSSNTTYNFEYYEAIAATLHKAGFHIGVFSNQSNWQTIFGNVNPTAMKTLPLWYAYDDGQAGFENSGQSSFAGWKNPEIK